MKKLDRRELAITAFITGYEQCLYSDCESSVDIKDLANKWLDDVISDAGHTVADSLGIINYSGMRKVVMDSGNWQISNGLYWNFKYGHKSLTDAYKLENSRLYKNITG